LKDDYVSEMIVTASNIIGILSGIAILADIVINWRKR